MNKRISVIIVSYNRPREVEKALQSLLNQSVKPFEIIVIDDGSNPPLDLKVDFQNFKIVRFNEEVGLSNARNYGISVANGEFIAFVDDDTIVSKNWLAEIQEGIRTGADILGGPLEPLYLAKPPNWWTEKDFGGCAGIGNAYNQDIWGANMVFRKSVFDKIGFFDSRIGRQKGKLLGCEEIELLEKARSCCTFLFVPKAIVFHFVQSKRMTLRYIIIWHYYWGKSVKILEGRKTMETCYGLLINIKNMLNPFIMLKKSARIKQIARLAFLFGRLL